MRQFYQVVINPDGVLCAERADAEHMVRTGHHFPPGKVLQLSKHLAGETMNRLGTGSGQSTRSCQGASGPLGRFCGSRYRAAGG